MESSNTLFTPPSSNGTCCKELETKRLLELEDQENCCNLASFGNDKNDRHRIQSDKLPVKGNHSYLRNYKHFISPRGERRVNNLSVHLLVDCPTGIPMHMQNFWSQWLLYIWIWDRDIARGEDCWGAWSWEVRAKVVNISHSCMKCLKNKSS